MRKLITAACFMLAAAPLALAQDKGGTQEKKPAVAKAKQEPTAAQKKQQERMRECNEKVGDRKGDDRKKFMSACLKGQDSKASGKQSAQQQKMKDCNRQAADKKLKGDERKGFMSACLKS